MYRYNTQIEIKFSTYNKYINIRVAQLRSYIYNIKRPKTHPNRKYTFY